jgi:DNA polymerase III alpha subunit|tara:strand:- start:87 stop:827 length:741 start_codon:yes stop_codon:yes gene_type:complete
MEPLFKTCYSIGKSVLTLADPNKVEEGGADSAIAIAKEADLKRVTFVEDNFHGFLEARKRTKDIGASFVFGLRLKIKTTHEEKESHMVVIFAKNDEGCKRLYKIYTSAFCDYEQCLTLENLREFWDNKDLKMVIPFYDSFIYYNNFTFSKFIPNLLGFDLTFFLEDNGVSYDKLLEAKVKESADHYSAKTKKVKTIYYKNKLDFKSYQAFKIICGRMTGRRRTLDSPGLDHCCSDRFSFEAWNEEK